MNANLGLDYWLSQWTFAPSVILGCALVIGLYLYGVGPLRKKYHLADSVSRGQVILFVCGVLAIFFAVVSPIDEIGHEYLFSAHMVQHLLITVVGPPLMVAGMPGWLIAPILQDRTILKFGRFLTHPFVAFTLFFGDFFLWHAPPLYNETLTNESLHVLEHLTFIVFATIYWWPLLSPVKEGLPRLSIGGQILYLFLSGMPTMLLGAGLTFMQPLYAPYIKQPVRAWGFSPAFDQQLGGLVMWVPGNILNIIVMSILFLRWLQLQDQKQKEEDKRFYGVSEGGPALLAEAEEDEEIITVLTNTEGEVVDEEIKGRERSL
uniref:Membrane protein n=1 Tax=Thermosporothrix sp. COM3 TaxID=2490863 RepID=A0A455SSH8_9CHLR|nr:membrane protein [Thermosporothrix sp. COM3]